MTKVLRENGVILCGFKFGNPGHTHNATLWLVSMKQTHPDVDKSVAGLTVNEHNGHVLD